VIRLRCREYILVVCMLLGTGLVPDVALGQAGFYLTPSLSVSEVYDDNVFFDERREGDVISRFTPSLEAGYRSAPLTLLGRYSFTAEVFAKLTEQTNPQARQQAALELRYLPTRLLTLSLRTTYIETHNPENISQVTEVETQPPEEGNQATGVELGRRRTTSFSVSPSVAYRFSRLLSGTGGYAFTRTEQSGGTTSETHAATLGLSRRLTPRDTASVGAIFRYFRFEDDVTGGDSIPSYAITLGWARQLTRFTSVELHVGPRFTEGEAPGVEAQAALSQRLKHGRLGLRYVHSQGTISGESGVVNSDTLAADVSYQLWRRLGATLETSFSRSTDTTSAQDTNTYRVNLRVAYQVSEYVSLLASYQFTFQNGPIDTTDTGNNQDIYRNVFMLQLVVSRPYRVY
jgi:hypothetical protein